MSDLYKEISERRKKEQAEGLVPPWFTTGGAQMFYDRYEYQTEGRSVRGQFERIARTAASYLKGTKFEAQAYDKFMELMWNRWVSLSTPVYANMGTNRGMSVSCSGSVIGDSIDSFYSVLHETAMLTKNGFGTSAYMGDIRPRGSSISVGGKSSGVVPVFTQYVDTMRKVAQGTARRGAWAAYLPIDHGDFDELVDHVAANPDDANVGWNISDNFISKLNAGDQEAIRRYQKAMHLKMVQGKGYYSFIDKLNAHRPQMYVDHNLFVKSSNLCDEITLFADEEHTFTCVLSSMIDATYDEWKNTDAVYWATIFLDCVAEDFIQKGKNIPGLEKAVRFTQKGRALGLGQAGFHTLLQQKMIPFESLEAHMLSQEIAKHIHDESLRASQDMAKELGEPEWCKGYGVRNTHRTAIAPTKSSALLFGGMSEGINPDPAMTYTQLTSAGEIDRINPILLQLMKDRGIYSKKKIKEVVDAMGSVQGVDWLTPEEKEVFKTAFEINQNAVLRMASARSKYLCQWQSLNLYFSTETPEEVISEVHQNAFNDPNILGLYYIYSLTGIKAAQQSVCVACE